MVEHFGFGVLLLSLVISLYGIAAILYGMRRNRLAWVESARVALLINFPLIGIVVFCLFDLLITRSYQVAYVFTVTSDSMPEILRWAALWGGESGALLAWLWVLSGCSAALVLRKWKRDREYLSVVMLILLLTLVFFQFLILNFENPFVRFWQLADETRVTAMFRPPEARLVIPGNGVGLNPTLRSPWMSLYLPLLYMGCALLVTPYAFGVSALINRRTDHCWFSISRRWTLLGWLFLSIGISVSSRSITATDLSGGFWKWGQIEMAVFLPWLSSTSFLHAMMVQEKRELMKRWNMAQAFITFVLAMYGIYIAQLGLFETPDFLTTRDTGPLWVGFLGLAALVSLSLLVYRWRDLNSAGRLSYLLSKESLLMYSNLIFLGLLLVTIGGLIYPVLARWIAGQEVIVDSQYYRQATTPLLVSILLLMAVSQLSSWGYSNARKLVYDLWRLVAASAGVVAVIFLGGVHRIKALLSFWLVAFVIVTIFFDLFRGTLMRSYRYTEKPLTAFWRLASSAKTKLGGTVVHLGLALVALGVVGLGQFQVQTQTTLALGESVVLDQYTITYHSLEMLDSSGGRNVLRAVMLISSDGIPVGEAFPRRDYYFDTQQSITTPGLHGGLWGNLYVVMVDWPPISAQSATFRIYYDPLVFWLWSGVWLVVVGTVLSLAGEYSPEPEFRFRKPQT